MSDTSQGPGWWRANDGKWYAPELHPDYSAPAVPPVESDSGAAEAVATIVDEGAVAADVEPSARKFPRWVPLAVVAVVVGAGLAVLLVSLLGSSSSAAGAESPEAAFDGMIAALDTEDGIGLVSLVDLEDFGLVSDVLDTGSEDGTFAEGLPGGLDLTITGRGDAPVTATYRELGGPDAGLMVAALDDVEITLTRGDGAGAAVLAFTRDDLQVFSTGEIDPGSELTLTLTNRGSGFEADASGRVNGESVQPDPIRIDDVPMELVFIEHDGRWFFSLGYTIANLAVQAGVVDAPDYGAWRRVLADESSGGDTPVAAITRVVNAVPDLDLDEGMQAVDPIETKLLHDFLPQILDAIADPRADALNEGSLEIVDLDLSEEIDGNTAQVFIELIAVRGVDDRGDEVYLELDGSWCYRLEDEFDTSTGCLDRDLRDLQDVFDDQVAVSGLDVDLDLRDLLPDRPFVTATLRDGNWYFSPLATIAQYSAELGAVAGDAVSQLERELGNDIGFLVADATAYGATTVIEVPADGVAGLPITVGSDDFLDADGFEVAMAAVTISTTGTIEIQHNTDVFFDDELNTQRIRAGDPVTLVASSEDDIPRSPGFIIRNDGAEPVTVTVTVTGMPFQQIGSQDSFTGLIDAAGTPWLIDSEDEITVSGAEFSVLEFERFPWFELDPGEPASPGNFVFVVGEPGAEFTITTN